MPIATPPPPSPIEHAISLDERLGAAAERVPVPDQPGHTVSASLAHLPSRMHVRFGTDEEHAPVLELKFEFLDEVPEDTRPGSVRETQGGCVVAMSVGEHTGRIYRLAMRGVDPNNEASISTITEGIAACLRDHVGDHNPTLPQQAILRSMAALVTGLLPDLVCQIRDSIRR